MDKEEVLQTLKDAADYLDNISCLGCADELVEDYDNFYDTMANLNRYIKEIEEKE